MSNTLNDRLHTFEMIDGIPYIDGKKMCCKSIEYSEYVDETGIAVVKLALYVKPLDAARPL